jgi:hypothetical protein
VKLHELLDLEVEHEGSGVVWLEVLTDTGNRAQIPLPADEAQRLQEDLAGAVDVAAGVRNPA